MDRQRYIPAAGWHGLTPLYDPLQRWLLRERTLKGVLIARAQLQPGQRVLDLGCGTGTLALSIRQQVPRAQVVGLDVDADILGRARRKARAQGITLPLVRALATRLPFPTGTFDRVLSSLVLHHLPTVDKRRALSEVYRVLRPAGHGYILDFGRPHSLPMAAIALVMGRLEETADHVRGRLPALLREAGFEAVEEVARFSTVVGTMTVIAARKPGATGRGRAAAQGLARGDHNPAG